MTEDKKLTLSLFLLRLSVFIVMFMWTLDKFVRPSHASLVYETFYLAPVLVTRYPILSELLSSSSLSAFFWVSGKR